MTIYPELTTKELQEQLGNENVKIVDVRPIDAYNGWRMRDEPRGGHIRSTRTLPAKLTKDFDWAEMVDAKGIMPGHKVILYGYDEDETKMVAGFFTKAGFGDIHLYHHFVDEWSPDTDLPMEHLARYRNLVPAGWVKDLIDGKEVQEYDNEKYIVCHAHYRNREAYLTGHIPGAIDIDTLALESPETWNRRSPEELKKALENHGITTDTTVILYGKYMRPNNADEFPGSAAGHIGAIRCALIMMYAGVRDVRVLNGGWQSWKEAGYEVSTENVPKKPFLDFGTEIPSHPELFVDTEEAKGMLKAKDSELVSIRSWPEYIGEVSGYNYIEKKGRIPGSVFGNCGSDAYHMENYRNDDHTTREYHEIEERWKEAGITPDKHLAFYCGTGWRGSEAFYNAWLMGWPCVSVYDGGWFEWSNDPDNPYETGIPEGQSFTYHYE